MARHQLEGARETFVLEKPASEAGVVDEPGERRRGAPPARAEETERPRLVMRGAFVWQSGPR